MGKNAKVIIIIIILLGILAALYYFFIYKKKPDPFAPLSDNDNFKFLQQGLGITARSNVLTVKFNEGKNQADFYDNGRVIISKVGATGYIVKGSYKDSGKSIYLDNGKEITAPTPWGALEQTII